MFSGNESTDSQNYTQWALNPTSYQNVNAEQVDWAALAHEWIRMKEAGPPIPTDKLIATPAAPVISTNNGNSSSKLKDEGGEAPMEVENDWEAGGDNWSTQPPNWFNNSSTSNWPPIISSGNASNFNKAPLLPTPPFSYSSRETLGSDPISSNTSGGYWSGNNGQASSKVVKPHNKRYSKVNIPNQPAVKANAAAVANASFGAPTLDLNKRKQLPAWIREGLEKMERDKLKQMDKNRELSLEEQEANEKRKMRESAMEILKLTVKEQEELKEKQKLSAYINQEDETSETSENEEEASEAPPAPRISSPEPLTHEELMLKVRHTMTEILLKVTNREIQSICKEELQRHVRKQKASEQRVVTAPSGANLSAKLGLGAYGDGTDESTCESDGEDSKAVDSDQELKETIRRRKEEFSIIEKQIESKLAAANKDKQRKEEEEDEEDSAKSEESSDSSSEGKRTPPRRRRSSTRSPSRSKLRGKKDAASQKKNSSESSSRSSSASERRQQRSRKGDRRRSRTRSRSRDSQSSRSKTPRRRRRSPSGARAVPKRRYSGHSSAAEDRYSSSTGGRRRYSRNRSRSRSRSSSRYRSGGSSGGNRRRGGVVVGANWRSSRSRSPYSDSGGRRRRKSRTRSRSNSSGRGKRSSHRH